MAILLNPKAWIAAGGAVLLIAFAAFFYQVGGSPARAELAAYKLAAQEARILADKARTRRAEARQTAADKEALDGQAKIAALETDLADTRAAGQRLRDAIRTGTAGAGPHPRAAGAGQGQPGADPLGLFAQLLERADARAERVGEYADRLAIAGRVCERAYDALTHR